MAITFVTSSTATYSEHASGATNQYTLNKPTGVQANDLMLAIIVCNPSAAGDDEVDVYPPFAPPPTGWTHLATASNKNQGESWPCQISVLYKFHDGSEPTSWTGTAGASVRPWATGIWAYRGVDTATVPTFDTDNNGANSGSLSGTVNVTDANGWCVLATTYNRASGVTVSGSTETQMRINDWVTDNGAFGYGVFDSGAAIGSTGNRTRGFNAVGDTNAMVYMFLDASISDIDATLSMTAPFPEVQAGGAAKVAGTGVGSAPAAQVALEAAASTSGDLGVTAPFPTYQGAGEILNFAEFIAPMPGMQAVGVAIVSGTASGTSPMATMDMTGTAPDPVFMIMDAVAPMPGFTAEAESESAGIFTATAPMASMALVVETRQFGERVVEVEYQDRRYSVELDPVSYHEL